MIAFPRLLKLCVLAVSLMSLVCLASALARLSWVIIAEPGHDIQVADPVSASAGRVGPGDFSVLERMTPFRRSAEPENRAPAPADAPDTTLDLVLHGVLMRADTGGVAYISVGQEAAQKSYRVGDTIDAAGGVEIQRILPGAVILDRDGQRERLTGSRKAGSDASGIVTLRDGAPAGKAPAPETDDRKADAADAAAERDETEPKKILASITRQEAEKLAGSIRFDDRTGQVEGGFTIYPTRQAELFAHAGLRGGDVVQEIGGVRLGSVSDFERVFADLETQSRIDVRLVRGGRPRLLTIRLRDERPAGEGE
ncbi:MAG: hypothetical protein GVY06_06460 [Alphaproteobacteria bacterium]|nr:hypothetical protein [Alphaproteobacteria bacterium]